MRAGDQTKALNGDDAAPVFRFVQPSPPEAALGMAVAYLMTRQPYAGLPFGSWSDVLMGQVRRGHYGFVADADGRFHGFVGWTLTDDARGRAWLDDGAPLLHDDCLGGDCVVINAWAADGDAANAFILLQMRRLLASRNTLYGKRVSRAGQVRPFRARSNPFLGRKIERAGGAMPSHVPADAAALAAHPH